jgi:putative ABC transport system permease protein
MRRVWQDLKFGSRMVRKNPAFTVVAVLTLALGIGANTAIFSVINAVLLEPLPYKDPGKLVFVWSTFITQGVPTSGSAPPDFRIWRDWNDVFSGTAAYYDSNFDFSAPGEEPSQLLGGVVSPNMFSLLGAHPILGREFTADEEVWGRHQVLLLSYTLWQSRFGGSRDVLGRSIHLDGQDYTIIGVMPRGMPFFKDVPRFDLWVPLSYAPKDDMNTRSNHYLNVVARLKRGVTLAQAQSEMSRIAAQIEKQFPENKGMGAKVEPVRENLVGDVQRALLVLLGAVAFVLLIACVNVANLMLSRASAREQEFAVRRAMGASPGRLLGQLLLESLPIALFGGIGGVLLAMWGVSALESLIPSSLPRFNPVSIDGRVLAFTVLISLLTALLFSLAPAFHAANADVQDSLREGGRSGNDSRARRRLRSFLVVSEIALAMLLLVGAGLLIKTFAALHRVDPGFSSSHVLTMEIPLSPAYFPDRHEDQANEFFASLTERVRALPGVSAAGFTTALPLGFGGSWGKDVTILGHAPPTSLEQVPIVQFQLSTAGYFPAIGARLREGRFFADTDNQKSPSVAIINESFAKRFYPNEDPIGKSIRMLPPLNLIPPGVSLGEHEAPVRTIVGVLADMKDSSLSEPPRPTVFAPYAQYHNEGWDPDPTLAVGAVGDPMAVLPAVRDQLRSILPDQPIAEIHTGDELLEKSVSQTRFSTLLLGIFAGLALILAAIGIYGVMVYSVVQRTHEMGIRVAIGARPADVLRLIFKQGAALALTGVTTGIVAAMGLTRLMASLLYGVSATDPLTFAAVAIILVFVALLACYIPAARAARVDPMIALRYE